MNANSECMYFFFIKSIPTERLYLKMLQDFVFVFVSQDIFTVSILFL